MKERKHLFISLYSFLVIFSIIGLMTGISFIITSAVYRNIPFLIGSIIHTFIVTIVAIFVHTYYKKRAYGKSPVIPYKYIFPAADISHVFRRLSDTLPFIRLDNNVCCARYLENRYYTHWFMFSIRDFDTGEFRHLERESVLSAVEAGLIPRKMSRDVFLHSTRCCIIVTDSMNESLQNFLSRNAVESLSTCEGITYCAVVLSESAVFVPCLWGGTWGHLRKYKRVLKNLSCLFQFEI